MEREFMNVQESWPIFDTLLVSQDFAQSSSDIAQGWQPSFGAFANQETYSFFKQRTEGSADLAYTNKQSADTMDFAFELYSIGVSFFSPGVRTLGTLVAGDWTDIFDSTSAHWWEAELPRHCAIALKVNQDIVCELPCMAASPGYGPHGGGASFEHPQVSFQADPVNPGTFAVLNMAMTAGVPNIQNRWKLKKIGIPRTATVEAILTVSAEARAILSNMAGPLSYIFPADDQDGAPPYTSTHSCFGIQVSMLGKRMVQQRGSYHR